MHRGLPAVVRRLAPAAVLLVAACTTERDAAAPQEAPEPTCVTGSLRFTWASAEDGDKPNGPVPRSGPVRASDWELRAGEDVLATGTTDSAGAFEACVDGELPAGARLAFPASSRGLWRVVDDIGGAVHTFDVPVTATALGAVDVRAQQAGAWKVVDATGELYAQRGTDSPCWTAAETEDCTALTIVWAAGRRDGGYFDVGDSDAPVLAGEDAASRHTIVHEVAHWFQWLLYDGRFPRVTDCTPHFIEKVTSPSCAWTEGFADAVAAYVLGDEVYVHDSGLVQSFTSTPGLPVAAGDAVEGNVAAALLDLWALAGGWEGDLAAMTGEPSADLREYVAEDRPAAGLPLDAGVRAALRRSTIVY